MNKSKSDKLPKKSSKEQLEEIINKDLDSFRRDFTDKYNAQVSNDEAYFRHKAERYEANPKNAGKEYKGKHEPFDMNKSTILAPYLVRWEELLKRYKSVTGNDYKKPIIFNANREEALRANQAEKDKARKIRDKLIAKKEAEKVKSEASKPKPKAKPVNEKKIQKDKAKKELLEQYNMTEKEYNELVKDVLKKNPTNYDALKNETYIKKLKENRLEKGMTGEDLNNLIQNATKTVPTKIDKGLFTDMKDLVNSVIEEEKKIEGLKPHDPSKHGNKDRTGKILTDEELAQLKRIRERLAKNAIPENVIVKKRRGRPIVEGSLRQKKLASTEPVVAKKRGRPPKKVVVEETKEETKQEETKEETKQEETKEGEPKKKRGRPKKPDTELSRPRVVPELVVKGKKGRPSRCEKVLPKNNVKLNNVFNKPIIEWYDIDKKHPLSLSQKVEPKLLQYSKMNKDVFFDIMDMFFKFKLGNIKGNISKNATKDALYVVYRKICDFAIFYGFTTAYEIENALIMRISGDLQDKPAELKRFEGFIKKNCIGKKIDERVKKEAPKQAKVVKNKVYDIKDLTNFYEVPIEGKVLKEDSLGFGYIVSKIFTGKNASLRLKDDDTIEIVEYDMDEDGNELTTQSWIKSSRKKMLFKGLIKKILDALKEVNVDNYDILDKQFKDDPEYVYQDIQDFL